MLLVEQVERLLSAVGLEVAGDGTGGPLGALGAGLSRRPLRTGDARLSGRTGGPLRSRLARFPVRPLTADESQTRTYDRDSKVHGLRG